MTSFRAVLAETLQHPIGPNGTTVRIPLRMEIRDVRAVEDLEGCALWRDADLTPAGRRMPRERTFKARELRLPGDEEPCGLLVWYARVGGSKRKGSNAFEGPKMRVWEEEAVIMLGCDGFRDMWRGDLATALSRFVDHLVTPRELDGNGEPRLLTHEEVRGYLDRAAAAT